MLDVQVKDMLPPEVYPKVGMDHIASSLRAQSL